MKETRKYLPIVQSTTAEVISAHVKVARNLTKQAKKLKLGEAFSVYEKHPNHATPATRHEEISYDKTFEKIIRFFGADHLISYVTPETAKLFFNYLKPIIFC